KTIASGTTQTSDITGLAAGTTYYFRITATGTGSYTDSDYSSTASAATSITPVGPAADPVKAAGVKSTASLSTATLTWTANARNAQYVITCTSHSGIAPQTVTGNSVTIEGLQPGTSYKFEIVAKNADGKAAATVKASVKTQKYTAIKMGKAISTLGSVTLNWTASTMTETTGYKVYRVDSKTKVETLIWEGTTTTATINNLAPGTKYNFVVRAVAADLGIQSANAKASAATTKYAAVKKGKSANTPNSITLNWTASSFAETTGYEVYRVDPKTKAETLVWQGTATTATIDELLAGTKYTFIVRAVSSTLSIQSLATKISASTAK
ncbi:MAG: fibronectin type III domain-containing protein, partial [Phycisphaerales bacterium]|nr:fibronectin type III domain-containing protein [Phycisphaerales bacterium]